MSADTTAKEALSVEVTGLSPTTTQQSLEEYFSFVGTIHSATLEQDDSGKQKATLTFLRSSAASNAAMLNGGQLDGATISVSIPGAATSAAAQGAPVALGSGSNTPTSRLSQEDKPRTAIIAEYLAHGYQLSDDITKRAIALDQQHGWSSKWKEYLTHIDNKVGERYQQSRAAHSTATTSATQEKPADALAQQSEKQHEASKLPVPGASEAIQGPTTTTEVPAAASQPQPVSFVAQVQQQAKSLLNDPNSPVVQAQSRANEVLARPEVKARTDWAWNKLGEYYNKAANHPSIRGFYDNATRTVQDVHEEAKRIKQQRAAGATPALPSDLPAPGSIGRSSSSWFLVLLLLFASLSLQSVAAHGQVGADGLLEPAEIAGEAPHKKGEESYVQKHMANEHHIGAFDLGSFFALHDLNRDGVLDRSEIEAIYGVHHTLSVKHSPTAEIHDAKADKIVSKVLANLDTNKDGMITKREFINGGPDGLPSFDEYGINALGHHYDEESEYFVHHEEVFHNTPETQKDEAYTHKEDLEHFAHHDQIEHDEENRERHAEGMPSIEEEAKLKKEAEARGEKYHSQWEDAQHRKAYEQRVFHEMVDGLDQHGYAQDEAEATEHVFRTPSGLHATKEHAENLSDVGPLEPLPGETKEGFEARKVMFEQRKQAADYFKKLHNQQSLVPPTVLDDKGKLQKLPHETDEQYRKRLNQAKWESVHKAPKAAAGAPADDAMRKVAPAKYPPLGSKDGRRKGRGFMGEF